MISSGVGKPASASHPPGRRRRDVLIPLGIGTLSGIFLFLGFVVLSDRLEYGTSRLDIGPVKSRHWNLSVTNRPTKIRELDGIRPAGVFVLVPVTLKNVDDTPSTFSEWQMKIEDSSGRQFNAADSNAQIAAGGNLFSEPIGPGGARSARVVFDVPEDANPLTLKVQLSFSSAHLDLGFVR